MNTKIIKQAGMSVLALGVVFALGACSSKPSPWSQQSSPWDNRQSSEQEVATVDEMAAQSESQSPFVNDAEVAESSGIAEPVEMAMEEPVMEEAMMEEPMAAEAEAMAEPESGSGSMMAAAVGGDINSQPPGHFAVQVVASSNIENLKAFAQRNQISDEWVAETSLDGKTWFVLLQGVYPTISEAKEALEQVNATLDTSPWVRSVGSLQAVMIQ